MTKDSPEHLLEDLIKACKDGGTQQVFVSKGAQQDAASDFNLHRMDDIINFIGNGGLEDMTYKFSETRNNNPDQSNPQWIDVYHFKSIKTHGYFAFFKGPDKWIIKSFKKNKEDGFNNKPFEAALKGIQGLIGGDK